MAGDLHVQARNPWTVQIEGVYRLSDEEAERFARLWSLRDPKGRMRIPEAAAISLIAQLPTPLGTAARNVPAPAESRGVLSPSAVLPGGGPSDAEMQSAEMLLRRLPIPPAEVPGYVQVCCAKGG